MLKKRRKKLSNLARKQQNQGLLLRSPDCSTPVADACCNCKLLHLLKMKGWQVVAGLGELTTNSSDSLIAAGYFWLQFRKKESKTGTNHSLLRGLKTVHNLLYCQNLSFKLLLHSVWGRATGSYCSHTSLWTVHFSLNSHKPALSLGFGRLMNFCERRGP